MGATSNENMPSVSYRRMPYRSGALLCYLPVLRLSLVSPNAPQSVPRSRQVFPLCFGAFHNHGRIYSDVLYELQLLQVLAQEGMFVFFIATITISLFCVGLNLVTDTIRMGRHNQDEGVICI